MIGPRILTGDELAIDNQVGREINRPSDHFAASRVSFQLKRKQFRAQRPFVLIVGASGSGKIR
jgi:ABC-type lipoprotein export system ATPase subunit